MKIEIVGIGMGSRATMTGAAMDAICFADLIMGGRRMLDSAQEIRKNAGLPPAEELEGIAPSTMLDGIKNREDLNNIAVLCSGDTGFFSLGKSMQRLADEFPNAKFITHPGMTTVQYLAARLGRSWQQVKLASAHGRGCNILGQVLKNEELFLLTGGEQTPRTIIDMLVSRGLGHCEVAVGERLSYEDEVITTGTAAELAGRDFDKLSAIWISHGQLAQSQVLPYVGYSGIPDELFVRGNVPMTKRDVRALVTTRLRPADGEVVWDIGAGTGSVSVETACLELGCRVYAIEFKPEGCELIAENAQRFGAYNVEVVEGRAPEAFLNLLAPDVVFVGGSTGGMDAILRSVLELNPACRIVMTAVTLETIAQGTDVLSALQAEGLINDFSATQVAAAASRVAGRYHLMQAESPILIFDACGAGEKVE